MDPYSGNPFRVLGVRSNTSGKEAGRCADRLVKWIELGEIPQVEDLLPYLGLLRRNREQIKQATKEIEDPRTRIRSELYWPSAEFSAFEACQEFLKSGRYDEFADHCEKALADGSAERNNDKNPEPQLDACLACHYLAVFYHSAAIAADGVSVESRLASWDQAFHYWTLVIKDDAFWTYLVNRARLLNDPRVNASDVQELRRELPFALLRVNVSSALASLEREQSEDFIRNCIIIRKAQLGSNGEQALKEVALALQSRFEKTLREIQTAFSESAIRRNVPTAPQTNPATTEKALDPQKLTAYLAGIEDSLNKSLVPIGRLLKEAGLEDTEPAREMLDGLAYAFRALSLACNNYGGMPHAALRLTNTAKQYAGSIECNKRLDEDYQILQFLSLQKDAAELAAASRYKESLTKLEAARQFASSDEEKRTIDEWAEVAKKHLVLEGIKQIDTAPTMYTFNGIGTKLYGKRNYDPQTQSYIATLYFTFVFLPIFPLASYRVKDVGDGRYQFLGKVPLTGTAFIGPAIIAVILGFFIVDSNTRTTTTSPIHTPSSSVGTPSGTIRHISPHSSNVDKERLGQWIEQERARLTSVEGGFGSGASEIDVDHQSLEQKVNELNSRTASQEEIDMYEADRRRFNAQVEAFNTRLGTYKSDVARFNAEVNRYNAMH